MIGVMPSRRDQIRMSKEEQAQFIGEQKSLQVATINRDGTPHLSTLWFDVVDGDIVFETFTKSQKIKRFDIIKQMTTSEKIILKLRVCYMNDSEKKLA